MSTTPVKSEVRKRTEDIKRKIEAAYPNVDVQVAYWQNLIGENSEHWEELGFSLPRPWIHAYILIRGDDEAIEEAASLADAEIAHLLETTDVNIQVQTTHHVECLKSLPLIASSPPAVPTHTYVYRDKRGIVFSCSDKLHKHKWGRLTPQSQ